MDHLTSLELSLCADADLSKADNERFARHLAACETCRAQVDALRVEAQILTQVMQQDMPQVDLARIPKFSRPATLRGFAMANIATGLIIWLAQFLWKTLFGEFVMEATSWVTSIYLPDVYAVVNATLLYLLEEGLTMFDAYFGFVITSLATVFVLALVFGFRKYQASTLVCLIVAGMVVQSIPTPAHALELMRSEETITVSASEEIDDTLLIAGETVVVAGTVRGDLFIAARTVEVSGVVEGNLITFAEDVQISATVGGFVAGAVSSYTLNNAGIGGDLWLAAERITLDPASKVGGNASIAAQRIMIEGGVGRDLYAFADRVEVAGNIAQDVEAFTARLQLLRGAQIGGDVRLRSQNADALEKDPTVVIGGEVASLDMPEELEQKSRYATMEFYLWQIAYLLAAFLVGLVLFWLVPGLRAMTIDAGGAGLKSAGIGFLTLVSVPIMALIVAFTIVGLPFALIGIAAWILVFYLAKIVIGAIVGRMLLSDGDRTPVSLFVGLAIVVVAINLPFIGGIINFVLTILGIGLMVQYIFGYVTRRDAEPVS